MSRATRGVNQRRRNLHAKWDTIVTKLALVDPALYDEIYSIAWGRVALTRRNAITEALQCLGEDPTLPKSHRKLVRAMKRCSPEPAPRTDDRWQTTLSTHLQQQGRVYRPNAPAEIVAMDFAEVEARITAWYRKGERW
jgi:hypothetical protein